MVQISRLIRPALIRPLTSIFNSHISHFKMKNKNDCLTKNVVGFNFCRWNCIYEIGNKSLKLESNFWRPVEDVWVQNLFEISHWRSLGLEIARRAFVKSSATRNEIRRTIAKWQTHFRASAESHSQDVNADEIFACKKSKLFQFQSAILDVFLHRYLSLHISKQNPKSASYLISFFFRAIFILNF